MKKKHEFAGVVDRVIDGDTVRLRVDLGFRVWLTVIVRLENVFAAELDTPPGKLAAERLTALLPSGTEVLLLSKKIDAYGRTVGEIVRKSDSLNINDRLL